MSTWKGCMMVSVLLVIAQIAVAQKSKTIRFDTFEADSSNSRRVTFCIDIPARYIKSKEQTDIHAGLRNRVIYYADSSVIYIGNNIHEGSIVNFQNRLNAGYASFAKRSELDTVRMQGTQSGGKYWREDVIGMVVIGYLNVSVDKKNQYDKVLTTLRKEK